jgi:putative exporter of polyketide antibiotics
MVGTGIFLLIAAVALIIIGISFVYDIKKGIGPEVGVASVESPGSRDDQRGPRRTYTFLRIRGKGVAWFVTILTFVLAAGALVGGIVLIVMGA